MDQIWRKPYSGLIYLDKIPLLLFLTKNNLPFGEKGFILKYNGYIRAGVDLINFELTGAKSCKILFSKPYIIEYNYEKDNIYIYQEYDGVFNWLTLLEDSREIVKQMKNIENEYSKEILNATKENAEEMLTTFLESLGFSQVEIIYIDD